MDFLIDHKFKLLALTYLSAGLLIYKFKRLSGVRCISKVNLNGKTAIVTGANCGIGYETALELAKLGASVIIAGRDLKKSNKACEKIRKLSKNPNVSVQFLDLASLDSIKSFSDKILISHQKIDLLINNAGIMACPYMKTSDGFEYQFQVNYLGHYLLTRLLLDRIIQSSPSRIVNLTSKLYETGVINWADMDMENEYEPVKAYKRSKLCNILFTNQLAKYINEKQKDEPVSVFSVSPGVVLTNLGRCFSISYGFKYKILNFIFYPLMWYFMRTPNQGAQTTIYCAIEPSLKDKTGKFFRDCKETLLMPHASNEADAQKLWDLSEKMISKWLK